MKKILTALLAAVPLVAGAVTDIKVKPIESRGLPSAKNVRSGPHDLPIITWGGDIATILANGEKKVTQKDSIFKRNGLQFRLKREDVFENQIKNYLSGSTPYLRGTMAMINMAAAAVKGNNDLTPVVFYQLTWSAGGDALVVKSSIKKAADLCGKTIAINYDGPHLNYAYKVLSDAGCNIKDNTFVWTKDLTGTDETPMAALSDAKVDAAFVIIPDALALTSGGNIGDGSEDSVRGARILLSTKTANKVIADVYAVRRDYYQQHKEQVGALASSLFKAQEQLQQLSRSKGKPYNELLTASARLLLDAPEAVSDAEGLLLDADIAGLSQNITFFTNANDRRNFERIVKESAKGIKQLGIIKSAGKVQKADFNYAMLANGVSALAPTQANKFDQQKVAKVIERRQKQNSLDDATIFQFEVYFKPNQRSFNAALYEQQFKRVVEMSATYGGAVITVEGHSDPMGYLRKKKQGESAYVLNQIKQSAKNLSLSRAQQVRAAIIAYGNSIKALLDPTQFAIIGHGLGNPKTGICGADPCTPKSKKQWLSNMRVVFRIVQIEAEEDVFSPL